MECRCTASANENTRTDDAADAKQKQVPLTKRALQLAIRGFPLHLRDRFAREHSLHHGLLITRHLNLPDGFIMAGKLTANAKRAT